MEVLGGRGRLRDLDVVLGGRGQEPLDARRGVLGTLPLVPVGEQQHEAALLAPLVRRGDDELVEHDLRPVDEVAELRLPADQGVGTDDRVAVLERHAGELRQRRVVGHEPGLVAAEVVQGHVLAARLVVHEHAVALAERAASGVLAGQADRRALEQQRPEGELLAHRPVHVVGVEQPAALGELPPELRVDREVLGDVRRGHRGDDAVERLAVHTRGDVRQHALLLPHGELVGAWRRALAGLLQRLLELVAEVVERLLGVLDGQVRAVDELLHVALADAAPLLDRLVHERLGVGGVVALVVPPAPVADQVDHHVAAEGLAEREGEPDRPYARLGVVAVAVEDRCLHRLGDVGGVRGAAPRVRRGGETHLVVDDQVHGPTGAVAAELGERERLGDDALAGEGRVTVDKHGQDRERALALLVARLVAEPVEHRPRHALDHPVHRLQVGGVAREQDLDLVALAAGVATPLAEVVLHVARSLHGVGVEVAVELAEDLVVALAEDVRQHVEAPAVGHAEHGLAHAGVGGLRQQRVEHGDGRLRALEREALLSQVLGVQEALERLGGVQLVEDVALLVLGRLGRRALDLRLDPGLADRVGDVHVLDAERAAVRVAQHPEDVAEWPALGVGVAGHGELTEPAGLELAVEVPDRQAVGGGVELGVYLDVGGGERVQVGDQVAAHAVGVDELADRDLLVRVDVGAPGLAALVRQPADGGVGDLQRREDVVVEVVLSEQQPLDRLQEQPALRALDDAVVVGGGDGDDLAHAELGERAGVRAGVGDGVVDGAGADDHRLAGHQPRHAADRADRAGVRERRRRVLEQRHLHLAGLHRPDRLFVLLPEAREVERVRRLDVRHEQGALTLALDVDGEAEVHVLGLADTRLAVLLTVGARHRRHGRERADDGPADQVGEAHLAAPHPHELVVDDAPVHLEQLGGHVAERRRRRHLQGGDHVRGDRLARAPQRAHVVAGRRLLLRLRLPLAVAVAAGRWRRLLLAGLATLLSRGRRLGRRLGRGVGRGAVAVVRAASGSVVGEEVLPALADRRRVLHVVGVELLDDPGVRPELGDVGVDLI